MVRKLKNWIKNNIGAARIASCFCFIPTKYYLSLRYRLRIGKKLNLNNPKSFNEKLQWLKMNDKKSLYNIVVDKELVRGYVQEKIGEEYLVPSYGVWNKWNDIDFKKMPNQFVLKCTHDSGGVVVCENLNEWNEEAAKKKICLSLKSNFFWVGREWPYKNLTPRIIAEQYLGDPTELIEYKFMCFNGIPKMVFTCSERNKEKDQLYVTFFDLNWNQLPFERHYPKSPSEIEKPEKLEEMIKIATILAKDFPFVRVDLYQRNEKIYFGELTLYPGDGFEEFSPEEWDEKIGDWIILPNGKEK